MIKRLFVVLCVVTSSLSAGFFVTSASAATRPRLVDGVFDISRLDKEHRLLVKQALSCDDFNWGAIKRPLRRKTSADRIIVETSDLSRYSAVGASWSDGSLHVDQGITDPLWFQQIFMHEIGHMVDFFYLQPKKLQDDIAGIYGADWDVMGHDFNGGFTNAFSCFDAGTANGYLDETKVQAIRTLLGGTGVAPAKTL